MRMLGSLILGAAIVSGASAQPSRPAWCRALPRPQYKSLERVAVSDPWFEVYRVAPKTFAVYEPHQSEEAIGFLILGNTRALLWDTGLGIGNLKDVTAQLTRLPIAVLNSHTHDDHVGDNWQFDTVYSMDTAFSRRDAQGSRTDAQAEIQPGEICGTLPAGFHAESYATRPWRITSFVHDGEWIDLGGRRLQIVATPGHTPDSISLFDPGDALLFTGDTYYPGPIWLYRPETDLAAYGRSIRRLAALAPQVKRVLGSHNVPVASPAVLQQLVVAFEAVRAHKVAPLPAGPGKVTYTVGEISFLMRAPSGPHAR
ncbi:MAG TPA: MBL fold metallo-hydrolase [Acidobacteriaceae bacterium]|jgi:glyoxylase-like metal-dependent hydrolase (beta-lactamase superfamily II)|nr:MBL fold metallo-hydrolase [Acidobacteriaceae bacterium]